MRKKSKQIFNIRVASMLIIQVICHKLLTAVKTFLPSHLWEQGLGQGAQAKGRSGAAGIPIGFQDRTRALQGSADTRPVLLACSGAQVPGVKRGAWFWWDQPVTGP